MIIFNSIRIDKCLALLPVESEVPVLIVLGVAIASIGGDYRGDHPINNISIAGWGDWITQVSTQKSVTNDIVSKREEALVTCPQERLDNVIGNGT
jgi:hypothetical protein